MQFVLLRTFRNEADDIAKIKIKMIAVENIDINTDNVSKVSQF